MPLWTRHNNRQRQVRTIKPGVSGPGVTAALWSFLTAVLGKSLLAPWMALKIQLNLSVLVHGALSKVWSFRVKLWSLLSCVGWTHKKNDTNQTFKTLQLQKGVLRSDSRGWTDLKTCETKLHSWGCSRVKAKRKINHLWSGVLLTDVHRSPLIKKKI